MNISLTIKKVDSTLDKIIAEDLKILGEIKKHIIKSGGKRIRPLTHLIFCDLLGYSGNDRFIVAAISELIHAASLLHDDVVDGAETRRGVHTVGKLYGNKTAILAGDFLLACGIESLNRLDKPELMQSFTQVIRDLSVSELIQMQWEKNPKITEDIYEQIIYGKTASLFGAVTESAALLANLDKKEVEQFKEFGIRMGIVFQKRDDLLDYFANSKTSGKEYLKDFNNKLYTYPILVLRDQMPKKSQSLIQTWIEKNLSKEILQAMREFHIQETIQSELNEEIHDLIEFLSRFPDSKSKRILEEQLGKLRDNLY